MNINRSKKGLYTSLQGQTLIEVVVAVGVALVIIGSLVALMNASNRRATLARQATQASKLAQEGMEIVRNIRDAKQAGTISGFPVPCDSADTWDELYTCSPGPGGTPGPGSGSLNVEAVLEGPTVVSNWRLTVPSPFAPEDINLSGAAFKRKVVVADNVAIDTNGDGSPDSICSSEGLWASQTKRVSVVVEWESPVGHQERSTTTCLTRWRD